MNLSFSVVVNTYNRGDLLNDALTGLFQLDHPAFEVIVVNGPSTDRTAEVLEAWRGRVKLGQCPEPNLSMSRNVGIQMAAGDVVCFIDDDAVPHPAWLSKLALVYGDPRVGAVGGYTIDNSGVRFQVRKTVCDRYGNAHFPPDTFDERALCFPGTAAYPSLLGTNSSFRRELLRRIGGFDHAFAYLLDETDVCLRVVDAGYRVVYEPEALVFHQFAPSHIRSPKRVARTLYPSAVSKSYFIHTHGLQADAARAQAELTRYREEILRANAWLQQHGEISAEHRASLDDDLLFGLAQGRSLAAGRAPADGAGPRVADLDTAAPVPPFLPRPAPQGLRIVLVSRGYPPATDAGIARWTSMMAQGLARKGHAVHVVTAAGSEGPSTRFVDGVWLHAVADERGDEAARRGAALGLPQALVPWCLAVERAVQRLRSFGIDVLSFPIWDVEGYAVLALGGLPVVMSLHTSYALARPFKPEWNERPLFAHLHVDRVIEAEREALARAPRLLANSRAIVADLEAAYGVSLDGRVTLSPHGTFDPWEGRPAELEAHLARRRDAPTVSFVGRFEERKGIDLALQAFAALRRSHPAARLRFVGDRPGPRLRSLAERLGAAALLDDPAVSFEGVVDRRRLDELYIDSDVVLMPSRYESFGLVAIEAFAAGTPVIALAAGGLAEVVEPGRSGWLVAPGDDAAQAIHRHLAECVEAPDRLARMRRTARAAFEQRFTVAAMIDAAEAAYLEAVGAGDGA